MSYYPIFCIRITEGLAKMVIVIVQIFPLTFLYISGYRKTTNGIPLDQDRPADIYLECVS